MRVWLIISATFFSALISSGVAVHAEPFGHELELILRDAVIVEADGERAHHVPLWLYLRPNEQGWDRVWGKSLGLGNGDHYGLVRSSTWEGQTLIIQIDMLVVGDFWRKGKWAASYLLKLTREQDNEWKGHFEGDFHGHAVKGEIDVSVLPLRRPAADFRRPRPDERPRLLMREADLPALREKLKTPFGQRYLELAEESGDPINLGILYQLTRDIKYAREVEAIYARKYRSQNKAIPIFGFGSGGFGHEMIEAAFAYDLCATAWSPQMVSWMRDQLVEFTNRHQYILMTTHANFHPCSNYYGPGRGVPGVTALALWGEKQDASPRPPRHPILRATPLTAVKDWTPGKGVTISPLTKGELPTGWIWSGLLPLESSRDPLSGIGGLAKARPSLGSLAKYITRDGTRIREASFRFAALPEEGAGPEGIDLKKLDLHGKPGVLVFFSGMRVDQEIVVRLDGSIDGMQVWVSGHQVTDSTFYRLSPGVHPITLIQRAEALPERLSPRLQIVDESSTDELLALYHIERRLHEHDLAFKKKTGSSPEFHFWSERTWWQNYQHYRLGIGDGGFMAETGGYGGIASWYPSIYAGVHERFFGYPASAHPDVNHLIPRMIMQSHFPRDGERPMAKVLNSQYSLDLRWVAAHYPIIPEQYRPAALWVWRYLAGMDDAANHSQMLTALAERRVRFYSLTLAQTFLHYPLEGVAKTPNEIMPRHWRADTFGFYVFRSGWDGVSPFIGQVFLKASPISGWNHPNAGAVTLSGLGQLWSDAPTTRNGARENYSLVLLPEDEINASGSARLIHHDVSDDGSGTLTMEMSEVYAAPTSRTQDAMFVRDMSRLKPSVITGLRAVGFDYSGQSGAPALMVLVDQIEGGGKREWTWQLTTDRVTIEKNRFTVHQDGVTLQATFIVPDGVKLTHHRGRVEIGKARSGYHGQLNRIVAEGKDNFFVVITIQRDQAPDVAIDGKGLTARVKIGEQTVHFDQKIIVFGRSLRN